MPENPARWAPDPLGRHQYRYWDGSQWTEHVSDDGLVGTDPPIAGPTPAADRPDPGRGAVRARTPGTPRPRARRRPGHEPDSRPRRLRHHPPRARPRPAPAAAAWPSAAPSPDVRRHRGPRAALRRLPDRRRHQPHRVRHPVLRHRHHAHAGRDAARARDATSRRTTPRRSSATTAPSSPWTTPCTRRRSVCSSGSASLFTLLYFALVEGLTGGSLGKHMTGLRVVTPEGTRTGFGRVHGAVGGVRGRRSVQPLPLRDHHVGGVVGASPPRRHGRQHVRGRHGRLRPPGAVRPR